jgi:hypothetical protein
MSADQPDYHADHCKQAIGYMSEGHGVVAFAGNVGVSRGRIDEWAKGHPEFARALAVGRAKAVMFWEQKLSEIARTGEGNASAAIFGLKHASAEWAASQENETRRQTMTDLELARRIARILELGRQAQEKEEAKEKAKAGNEASARDASKAQAETPQQAETESTEPQSHDG